MATPKVLPVEEWSDDEILSQLGVMRRSWLDANARGLEVWTDFWLTRGVKVGTEAARRASQRARELSRDFKFRGERLHECEAELQWLEHIRVYRHTNLWIPWGGFTPQRTRLIRIAENLVFIGNELERFADDLEDEFAAPPSCTGS
jgi:hypothetical protein